MAEDTESKSEASSSPRFDISERAREIASASLFEVSFADEQEQQKEGWSPGGSVVTAADYLDWDGQSWDVVGLLRQNSPLLTELHVLPYDNLDLIARSLARTDFLSRLELNVQSPADMLSLANGIAHASPALHSLHIDWADIVLRHRRQADDVEMVLAKALKKNSGLTELSTRACDVVLEACVENERLVRVSCETGLSGDVSQLARALHLRYLRIGWGHPLALDPLIDALCEHARDHSLEELDVCSSQGKYAGEKVSEFLKRTSRLRVLSLRGCQTVAQCVAKGITWNQSLTTLRIHGLNSDPYIRRTELCAAISSHPQLRVVELRNMAGVTLADLASLVKTPKLQSLQVTSCELFSVQSDGQMWWDQMCQTTIERAGKNNCLEKLDLSYNRYAPQVFTFSKMPQASVLLLNGCVLKEGLDSMKASISSCKHLESLGLSVSGANLMDVVLAMEELPNLRELNLSDTHGNNMGIYVGAPPPSSVPYSAVSLIPLVRKGLVKLDLAFAVPADIGILLQELSQPGNSLRYLDISGPLPPQDMVTPLCQMIVHTRSLETLRLAHVTFTSDHMERIGVSLSQNRTITHFVCNGYSVESERASYLDELLSNSIAKSVIQELVIGSTSFGFGREMLFAIDASPYLHDVVVDGPQNFEADYLIEARHRLRWKKNVARVQLLSVQAAIKQWLLAAKRPCLVGRLPKDIRRLIAQYIWRTKNTWPLPEAVAKNDTPQFADVMSNPFVHSILNTEENADAFMTNALAEEAAKREKDAMANRRILTRHKKRE